MKPRIVLTPLCALAVLAAAPTPPPALPGAQSSTATVTLPVKSKATPAPPKDVQSNRVGISGVWEIALQTTDGVVYTHFKLTQKANVLTGQYLDDKGKRYPLVGTVDAKNVRVVVSMPDGTALVFTGTVDGATDMIGTLTTAKTMVGFTAAYRPKFKWIDNLTPGTGGMGGSGIP